jgi:hypothetical protein
MAELPMWRRMRSIVALAAAGARLDLIDANFLFTSESLGRLAPSRVLPRPRGGLIGGMLRFARGLALNWRQVALPAYGTRPGSRFGLCYAETHNQLQALGPVLQGSPALAVLLSNIQCLRAEADGRVAHLFPLGLAYLLALPFAPLVLVRYWRAEGYTRQSFRYVLERHWLAFGSYIVWRLLLRRLRPSCLVVANDHNLLNRLGLRAAADESIPTVYMQHAAVTADFPALSCTYAFLDGRDSLMKYDGGPSDTRVYLIGSPKMDGARHAAAPRPLRAGVGLCVNGLDSFEELGKTCAALRQALGPRRVIVRPHPRTPEREAARIARLATELECGWSDASSETALEFLGRVDVVVAGDSSILLEAALMNVYPFYFPSPGHPLDYYGFERTGLVESIRSVGQLVERILELLDGIPSVRERAKWYCDTVGTAFDGKSARLAVGLLGEVIRSGEVAREGWTRIEGLRHLEAYRLP